MRLATAVALRFLRRECMYHEAYQKRLGLGLVVHCCNWVCELGVRIIHISPAACRAQEAAPNPNPNPNPNPSPNPPGSSTFRAQVGFAFPLPTHPVNTGLSHPHPAQPVDAGQEHAPLRDHPEDSGGA